MNEEDTTQRPTNLSDLLAELIPPPEPEPISLVPQTLGWPIMLVLLVALAALLSHRVLKKRRSEAYRRAALTSLDAAGSNPADVALVLRQTALTAFPRTRVASLHGQDWLDFLVNTGGPSALQGAEGQALITLPYSDASSLPEKTVEMARHWIVHHDRAGVS